jgi:hypothetical protein
MKLRFGHKRGGLSSRQYCPFFIRKFAFASLFIVCLNVFLCEKSDARFATQFTMSVGEEYNDNIFFTKQREHDFITNITPTFTLSYLPPGAGAAGAALTLNISPIGQIFALHPKENNFGDNLNINGKYNYQYSPRLSFDFSEALQTIGQTQTGTLGGNTLNQTLRTPSAPVAPGVPLTNQNLQSFIPNGRTLTNQFSLLGTYLYAPDITINGGYANIVTNYLDQGGTDLSQYMRVRGSYKWRQEHNLYAGYTVQFLKTRDQGNSVVHNFDIGDDYFSNTQIQLTPTLTLAISTGISLNTSNDGPRIANNTSVQLTKLWEKATFRAGVFKGLTSSQGVSGLSDTTNLVTAFSARLTERLSAGMGANYSFYNTDNVNFKPFRVYGGLQYGITSWLCSSLTYAHQRLFSGSGGQNTVLQNQGNIYSNSLLLLFSASFDVWPNVGLAQVQGCGAGLPTVGSQLPQRPAQ